MPIFALIIALRSYPVALVRRFAIRAMPLRRWWMDGYKTYAGTCKVCTLLDAPKVLQCHCFWSYFLCDVHLRASSIKWKGVQK